MGRITCEHLPHPWITPRRESLRAGTPARLPAVDWTVTSADGDLSINPCAPLKQSVCDSSSYACLNQGSYFTNYASQYGSSKSNPEDTIVTINLNQGDYCMLNNPYNVDVIFTCGSGEGTPVPVGHSDSDPCKYVVTWSTKYACAGKSSSGGISGGGVFLIIFFVTLILYFSIGAFYNYKFRGLQGIEILPNSEFWMSLPSYIKDGCRFTYQKIMGLFGGSSSSGGHESF
ncbi:hypothetical protein H696_01267 [Fonticula alba]|uniref:Autophagy-related protein 27 n=1 Tax=Fonticula alba TaxID=691883 RepID=A0A058ZD45_FONAL|nr:hypothetical protein H696_01267 [Fonticula alba]KCV71853.1 hypothetical protein H696_01267 [Fonticula alba]|eukprot:XP_009493431.1 hypothetical protein H696_01267 [Fonticula alba]